MKVTFFSDYLNHHQLPFCLEMQKKLGDNFKFVATEKVSEERLALGYDDMNAMYDFVIRAYEDDTLAYELGVTSDVVVIGSAPSKYIKERLKKKKLTFRYTERIFKEGFNFRVWLSLIKNFTLKERNNVYLLCASGYTAHDFNRAFAYKNKTYKWGYFPEVKEYDIDKLISIKNKSKKIKLIWVARFLDWKHPEKVVEIAKRLKEDKVNFSIKMIGIGPMFDEIKEMIKENNLEKEVILTGAINNKLVRKYMEESHIFLFTSDYGEGWGAVLNESMNSACAVVASHAIGSVPFLIKNNENGLIYNNDSINDLYKKVFELVSDKKKIEKMGRNAYKSMIKYWNAKHATNELLNLSLKLLKGNKYYAKNGPCSKALSLSNKKMYKSLLEKK